MQEILCGPLCHVRFVTNATAQCNNYHIMERTHISRHPRHCVTNRWLTTAQRIVYMWTR